MIDVKPSERPPVTRYVIRNAAGLYYVGQGHGPKLDSQGGAYQEFGPEAGVPFFGTRDILFAIKYGDVESIEALIKNHKKWCIDSDRSDLFNLFESCEFLETYT